MVISHGLISTHKKWDNVYRSHKGGTVIKKFLPLESNCLGKSANGKWCTDFCTRIKCKISCNFFLLVFSLTVFIVLASDKYNLKLLNVWEESQREKIKFKELLLFVTKKFWISLLELVTTLPPPYLRWLSFTYKG